MEPLHLWRTRDSSHKCKSPHQVVFKPFEFLLLNKEDILYNAGTYRLTFIVGKTITMEFNGCQLPAFYKISSCAQQKKEAKGE